VTGFPAVSTDLGVVGGELPAVASRVGASAHVELFARVEQAVPLDLRSDPEALTSFVIDHEELFVNFDEEYDALEDAGDVLLEP
jgi:hypothetical protein